MGLTNMEPGRNKPACLCPDDSAQSCTLGSRAQKSSRDREDAICRWLVHVGVAVRQSH